MIGMLLAVLGVLYYNTVRYYENQSKKLPQFIRMPNDDLKYDNLLTRNVVKSATNGYANGNGYINGYKNGLDEYRNGYTNGYKNGYTTHTNVPTYVNIY